MNSSYSPSSAVRGQADIRLDFLHPIQPQAADAVQIKRGLGEDFTSCSGLRTQETESRGMLEEVRAEARRLKRELKEGGGYIRAPGITMQADVPRGNPGCDDRSGQEKGLKHR